MSGKAELVQGVSVYHDTQPSANKTVFFNWKGNCLIVYGVGNHTGGDGAKNDSYEFTWFDGKKKTFTRDKKQ